MFTLNGMNALFVKLPKFSFRYRLCFHRVSRGCHSLQDISSVVHSVLPHASVHRYWDTGRPIYINNIAILMKCHSITCTIFFLQILGLQ